MATTKRQRPSIRLVGNYPPIEQIRKPLNDLVKLLDEQPGDDQLKPAALSSLRSIEKALHVLENSRRLYQEELRQQMPFAKQAAELVNQRENSFQFATARDRRDKEKSNERGLANKAEEQIVADITKRLGNVSELISKSVVENFQAYDREIKKQRVKYSAPRASDLDQLQISRVQLRASELASWSPGDVLKYAEDLVSLDRDDAQEMRDLRLLLVLYLQDYRKREGTPAFQSRASRVIRNDQAASRGLERLCDALRQSEFPEWITWHSEQVFPIVERLFRVTCGIDPRQLSQVEFSKLYLNSNHPPSMFDVSDGWNMRYCNPANVEAAGKSFSLSIPEEATRSRTKRAANG